MAPRTPSRRPASEPFITLSISKSAASTLSQRLGLESSSPKASPSISIAKVKKSPSKKAAQKQKSNRNSTTTKASPKTERESQSATASPGTEFLLNGTKPHEHETSVRSSPMLVQHSDANEKQQSTKFTEQQFHTPASHALRDNQDLIGASNERRSSTASLTDGGTRSSGRTRKLTSKAQALAGTNFLPSLQNPGDATVSPSQNDETGSLEQSMTTASQKDQSRNGTPESAVVEAPVESVETPTIRTSARERKPTVRAIESENLRASRKRPASPSFIEKASKVAKTSPSTSIRSSKLRQSAVKEGEPEAEADSLTTAKSEQKEVLPAEDIEMIEPSLGVLESSALQDQPKDVDQSPPAALASEDQPFISNPATQDHLEGETATNGSVSPGIPNQDAASQVESQTSEVNQEPISPESTPPVEVAIDISNDETQNKEQHHMCDLQCLSPSTRLFAFARFAAEWPDSEEESDGEEDLDKILASASSPSASSINFMEKLSQQYCQCKPDNTKPDLDDTKSNGRASSLRADGATSPVSINGSLTTKTVEAKNTSNNRRSTRDKAPSSRYRPEVPVVKRRKIKHKNPTLLRQSSSFEQRMQNDYIAAKAEKQAGSDKQGRKQNAGLIRGSPPASPQISPTVPLPDSIIVTKPSVNGIYADAQTLLEAQPQVNGTLQQREITHSPAMAGPPTISSNNTKSASPIQQQITGAQPSVKASARSSDDKNRKKSSTKAGTHTITGSENSVEGGAAPFGSQEKTGHIKAQSLKQNSAIAPPQAKSIKLRFTTAAK